MTRAPEKSARRNQIPRLVWTLSGVGVCLGVVVMVVGFRSLEMVDEQYVSIRHTSGNTEALLSRINTVRDLAFHDIDAHLESPAEDSEEPGPQSDPFDSLLQAAGRDLSDATEDERALRGRIERIEGLFSQLRAVHRRARDNSVERASVGRRLGETWSSFGGDLAAFRARIDKAQGRARLQLQAGLRRGDDARTRLLDLAYTSDAVRALTVELGDLDLVAQRLRWTTDEEMLHNLRDNTLRQTIERLGWISVRLPDDLRQAAQTQIRSLSRHLLGDPDPGTGPAGDDLYDLKTRELRADAEGQELREQLATVRTAFVQAEHSFESDIRTLMRRDADRATAIYRGVWRDSLWAGAALLVAFLVFSSRIARLGRKTEIALRDKNAELESVTRRLEQLATSDTLTGLPNRRLFIDRLDQAIKHARRQPVGFAVLFFDFDRFKIVNDSLGHEVGDALLKDIARIFREELREADTVARFGGDEFVVLLNGLAGPDDAHRCAERLLRRFAEPHRLGEHVVVTTASVGLVAGSRRYDSAYLMIRDADAAMYAAKENGKGRIAVYDECMHASAVMRLTIEQDLHRAAAEHQLRVAYQPIVELESGRLAGFEALVRWEHPELGVIPPLSFVPIAEDTGTINQIGDWVLRTACDQAARWNRGRKPGDRVFMSVNVSKRQLIEPDFCENAIACINAHGIPPGDLKFEVTESIIAYDPAVIVPRLERLRSAGIPIVMDDFGTGVSSLSVLHECPIDNLKIDQAFVRALDGNRSLVSVVASITALADSLGVATVAEGVEDEQAVSVLLSVGCRWGQGFYFGRPQTPERATELLTADFVRRHAA